jgi:hypothetical protein
MVLIKNKQNQKNQKRRVIENRYRVKEDLKKVSIFDHESAYVVRCFRPWILMYECDEICGNSGNRDRNKKKSKINDAIYGSVILNDMQENYAK